MRLVKLSVERFQCIESAEVEFGPGLNVLYGPNDLGKSSLAWAIRAVLLLQHSSSQHERFVSWYGGGEPKVVLTFADANDRYWRVTKVFGGSVGLSRLEVSKDGRTFSTDANGRQVDEKIRKMLGWGINAPGGAGGQRGLPDAFLIQVLLAEQDNVRTVLFDSSLVDDPDESGRARLTAALGALAQDPMFKDILDEAQAHHDRAFTPTGRKKKSASSPFTEIDARIKQLSHEHEELGAKARETAMAEAKIAEQLAHRDALDRELRDARENLSTDEKHLAVQRQRDELRGRIDAHSTTVREATDLRMNIEATQTTLVTLQEEAELAAQRARTATQALAQLETVRVDARTRLDALVLDNNEGDRRREALEEAQRVAQEALQDAQRDVERTERTLKEAREAAASVQEAVRVSRLAMDAASHADQASVATASNLESARQTVSNAHQRLREATSDDKARERELKRSDLQNQRLTCEAARTQQLELLNRLAKLESADAAAVATEATRDQLVGEIEIANRSFAADERAATGLDSSLRSLVSQERCAQLRQQRSARDAATRAADEARQHRDRADQLRREGAAHRSKLRLDLPTSESIAALRTLRDELRIAEAQLAVGLSVTIRPKRAIALHTTIDGETRTTTGTSDALTIAARRRVDIRIDELVDFEIAAGEESARAKAAALRDRWDSEAAAILREHGANTIEDLEQLRADADANTRAAEQCDREAEIAHQRAEHHATNAVSSAQLTERIAELDGLLAGLDRVALEEALDTLGSDWQIKIARSRTDLELQRRKLQDNIDTARQQLARFGAQLEARAQAADTARLEAAHLRLDLPDAVGMADAAKVAVVKIERDLASIEKELAGLSTNENSEESVARDQVAHAESELALAGQADEDQRHFASKAREAAIQAATRVETSTSRAHEIDTGGVWTVALEAGAALALDHWQLGYAEAEQRKIASKEALERLREQLEELSRERAAAIQRARETVGAAEEAERAGRQSSEQLTTISLAASDELARQRLALADMKTHAASVNLSGAREAITVLQGELDALGPPVAVEAANVEHQRSSVEQFEIQLREAEQELAKARGALGQVGGQIVYERQTEIANALEQAQTREREVTIEYDAWKLLLEAMREAETAEGSHLGRALFGPISQRFRELTGGRYGNLEMGAHLESSGIQAAGELRDIGALSAGTQDQLATMLRICVAEQLRSSIVLDDHLSQSDPGRVGWFNGMLRNAAKQIQIVFITCRPSELLAEAELPSGNDAAKAAAAGQLRATDLTRLIRRYAGAPRTTGT